MTFSEDDREVAEPRESDATQILREKLRQDLLAIIEHPLTPKPFVDTLAKYIDLGEAGSQLYSE